MKRTTILTLFASTLFLIIPLASSIGNSHPQPGEKKKCPTVEIKGPKRSKGPGEIIYRGRVRNFSGGTPSFRWSFEGALVVQGEGTDVMTVQPITTTVNATLVVDNVPDGCQPSTDSLKTEITDAWVHPPPWISHIILSPSFIMRPCPARTRSESCPATINEVKVEADALVNTAVPIEAAKLFTWAVTAGRLIGSGRTIRWDLSGVANGLHTITVEVDYFGSKANESATLRIADCSDCKPFTP
jgi:hypothetical protein